MITRARNQIFLFFRFTVFDTAITLKILNCLVFNEQMKILQIFLMSEEFTCFNKHVA